VELCPHGVVHRNFTLYFHLPGNYHSTNVKAKKGKIIPLEALRVVRV
jgi:hypothetical protein